MFFVTGFRNGKFGAVADIVKFRNQVYGFMKFLAQVWPRESRSSGHQVLMFYSLSSLTFVQFEVASVGQLRKVLD